MIDFHSHILPKIDDGAKSAEMSLEMLRQSKDAGVTDIISTSHCYPHSNDSIIRFLKRRDKVSDYLDGEMQKKKEAYPQIHMACEVNLCTNAAKFESVADLRIAGTDYILLEMPFEPWRNETIEYVYNFKVLGLKPIMAHIDRFLDQKPDKLRDLFQLDVLYQVNTELFLSKKTEKYARQLLNDGHIHFLGSDMHNLTTRKPNMGQAKSKIEEVFGEDCIRFFTKNSMAVLNNSDEIEMFAQIKEKKSFFGKMFEKK